MKNADLDWYLSKSREINGPHRCPFAAANRCPRYYESLFLLGEVGIATKISPENKTKLDALWKDFEATIGEEAASISGGEANSTKAMSNFCPEVSYKIFGLFASGLFPCHGDNDRNMADSRLRRAGVKANDPRWHWADFTPAHYSECSEYSILQEQGRTGKPAIGGTIYNIENVHGAVGHVANSPVTVNSAAQESIMRDAKTASLTDCFSKLVGVTQAFENYVCYMPDENEKAKNRDDYAAKMRDYQNHLRTNLFVPPSLKVDIAKLLDEITRKVSHYIVGVETGQRPMGYKEHAAFVQVSDFAKDGCKVWLKRIEREFHHLLHPSGHAHADTISTIKTLHPKLKATKAAYDEFRQLMEPKSRKDDYAKLDNCFTDAWDYFSENRLYLGDTTSDCVSNLLTHIRAS